MTLTGPRLYGFGLVVENKDETASKNVCNKNNDKDQFGQLKNGRVFVLDLKILIKFTKELENLIYPKNKYEGDNIGRAQSEERDEIYPELKGEIAFDN